MKTIIALSGKMGSGKTAASDFLHTKYGAKQMRFSQILMDVLTRLHLPVERSTLQNLGHALRTCVGETVVVDAFRADLEAEDAEIIVVDGVRYPNEVELVRSFPGSILLYLDAPQRVRYERCVKRGEKGEASIAFSEFAASEKKETERHLGEIMKLADFVIVNEGSIAQLEQRIEEVLKDITACD
jgi:dephospho-CoA kinase